MPRGYADLDALKRLKRIMDSRRMTAARAAALMGLERTLIWRAYKGRPVTHANAEIIASKLHLISEEVGPTISHVNATDLLLYLLRAVEHYARNSPRGPHGPANR
jgi:transcriptional regulator with XRE-family HTH domain